MKNFKFDIDAWTGGNTLGKAMADGVVENLHTNTLKIRVIVSKSDINNFNINNISNSLTFYSTDYNFNTSDLKIDWGDGSYDTIDDMISTNAVGNNKYSHKFKHIYNDTGYYYIEVFNLPRDAYLNLHLIGFTITEIHSIPLSNSPYSLSQLNHLNFISPHTFCKGQTIKLSSFFSGCSSLEIIPDKLFYGCIAVKEDTLSNMFYNCNNIRKVGAIFDSMLGLECYRRVTTMFSSFLNNKNLNSIDIANLLDNCVFPNVTDASGFLSVYNYSEYIDEKLPKINNFNKAFPNIKK